MPEPVYLVPREGQYVTLERDGETRPGRCGAHFPGTDPDGNPAPGIFFVAWVNADDSLCGIGFISPFREDGEPLSGWRLVEILD